MAKKAGKKKPQKKYTYGNFKLRMLRELILDTNGELNAFINVNSLTRALVLRASSPNETEGYLDATNVKNLYDQYKVTKIHLHYIPKYNGGQIINPDDNQNEWVAGMPSFVAAYDIDNVGNVTLDEVMSRDGVRIRDLSRPFKTSFSIKETTSVTVPPPPIAGAFNQVAGENGYNDLQSEENHVAGVIWMKSSDSFRGGAGTAVPENTPIGTLKLTAFVTCRLRQ